MTKDFSDLIKEHYEPKTNLNFKRLIEMVGREMSIVQEEEGLVKRGFSAARFYKTALKSFDAPSEQAGKLGTGERLNFQKYITRNIKGATLSQKIDSINEVAEGSPKEGAKISEIMGTLGALKMLQSALDDFNESTAGFIFEAFLSGLLQGKQITDKVGGALPIEDCMFFVDPKTGKDGQPVSLKLLSPNTSIEGSITNLLSFFKRKEIAEVVSKLGIEYIVATKTKKNELDMYSFNITPKNFFYWIEERYFDFDRFANHDTDMMLQEQKTPEAIDASKEAWERAFLLRTPMFGLDPREVEFNYDWKTSSYWRDPYKGIARRASTSKANAPSVAAIMLSPAGKAAYAKWINSEFDTPTNIEVVEIPPELEAEFNSEDADVSTIAAKYIAKIGGDRMSAYFESVTGTGERVTEAPVHIQRWYAANKKGEQYIESRVVAKLNAMVASGTSESIMQWATILEGLRHTKETQFTINPIRVRSEGVLYGTVNVNKNQIYRTLQRYSKILETLCAPIYEELETLSTLINGYYLQNRVGDAFKAEHSANRLSVHTKELARTEEK